jgi:hypothetical protein
MVSIDNKIAFHKIKIKKNQHKNPSRKIQARTNS